MRARMSMNTETHTRRSCELLPITAARGTSRSSPTLVCTSAASSTPLNRFPRFSAAGGCSCSTMQCTRWFVLCVSWGCAC
jgi:hypothetical protein